ncbi:MAG: enoyl-CoA hydratase-related protein [Pseudolabrys sp.]
MSVTSGPVLWSIDERGVAYVALNRPEVYNAYNGDMIEGLLKAYDALGAKTLRAVVITGKGKNFQAGADVAWLNAVRQSSPKENLRASRMTAEAVQRLNLFAGAHRGAGARRLLRRRHRHRIGLRHRHCRR